ncbi:MAG TPA: efflux RND transporter periplasmic adaptor subunit [Acidobacteriaceae bacterium]|nr:efflux RND transporter periplasmic adaptor subunit [Acidobacteriaceae bacterium]
MAVETRVKPTHRRALWIGAAIVAVILIFVIRHFTREPVSISTATVTRGDLINTLSTNGKTEPVDNFEAHAPFSATVKSISVHNGDLVKKGQLLLSLDDSEARARLAAAISGLRDAQARLDATLRGGTQEERLTIGSDLSAAKASVSQATQQLALVQKLAAQGSASPSEVAAAQDRLNRANMALQALNERKTDRFAPIDLERAKAAVADANAAVAAVEETLHQANVHAPFDGTVYSIPVQVTDFVQAGERLLSMADLKHVRVRAYFDEPEIGQLALGQPMTIVWDAKPGRVWHGHIERIPTTIINYGTRNVGEVMVGVDDSDGTLLPNTNVTVTVTTFHRPNVLTVPREALHVENGKNVVYEVVKNELRRRSVQVGGVNLTSVEIISGLGEHATVALGGSKGEILSNGLPIRVVQ